MLSQIPNPLDLAESLDTVGDYLDVMRESGVEIPDVEQAIATLEKVSKHASNAATSLMFLGHFPNLEMIAVALSCRTLAGDIRAVCKPPPE